MIRGELRALGPSQSLKSQYGEGYLVTVRLNAEALAACGGGARFGSGSLSPERGQFERVSNALTSLSDNVKEEDSATLVKRYEIPSADLPDGLASVFELLTVRFLTIENEQ